MIMKKGFVIIILIGCLANINSQALPESFIEAGYVPGACSTAGGDFGKTFYTCLGFRIPVFTYAFLEGKIETLFTLCSGGGVTVFTGTPFEDAYLFGVGVQVENVVLGVRHECYHPVFSGGFSLLEKEAGGGYTKIYIKYIFKLFE
jgi:hypothetical protein